MKMVARLCVQVRSCRCATGGKIQAFDRFFCGKKLTNEIDPTHFEKLRTWNAGRWDMYNNMKSFCFYSQCSHLNLFTFFPLKVDTQKI